MTERFKLQLVQRRVENSDWMNTFTGTLAEQFGPEIVKPYSSRGLYLELARRRDILRLPAYPAANPKVAERNLASMMPPSFEHPIHGVQVDRLFTMPTHRDSLIIVTIRQTAALNRESRAINTILAVPECQQDSFLFQVGLGYTTQRLSEAQLEHLTQALPIEMDFAPGSVRIVHDHQVDRSTL